MHCSSVGVLSLQLCGGFIIGDFASSSSAKTPGVYHVIRMPVRKNLVAIFKVKVKKIGCFYYVF